jgi:hypothetical protein
VRVVGPQIKKLILLDILGYRSAIRSGAGYASVAATLYDFGAAGRQQCGWKKVTVGKKA